MSTGGFSGDFPDTLYIDNSLNYQNICLACYESPRTIDDLSEITGLPKAYLEADLEWLIKKEFLEKKNGKYSTMFFIRFMNDIVRIRNLSFKHKATHSDKIIDKITARIDKIKAIGFYLPDKSTERLLWFLIYRYFLVALKLYFDKDDDFDFYYPIRPDGGCYLVFGLSDSEPTIPLDPTYKEKYCHEGLFKNQWCGVWSERNEFISFIEILNGYDENLLKITTASSDINVISLRYTFLKALKKGFDIEKLTDDEKGSLSKIISYGWLSISTAEKKVIPNFYVFTPSQQEQLEVIFKEIYLEMKDELDDLIKDIKAIYNEIQPKHLENYTDYNIFIAALRCLCLTIEFAFYDGKLYKPKNEKECVLLTLGVTVDK
jgi:hypothetical protein